MQPIISGREGDRIKIEVTIDLSGSMLEAEDSILRGVTKIKWRAASLRADRGAH
jgi:hypothetical protein